VTLGSVAPNASMNTDSGASRQYRHALQGEGIATGRRQRVSAARVRLAHDGMVQEWESLPYSPAAIHVLPAQVVMNGVSPPTTRRVRRSFPLSWNFPVDRHGLLRLDCLRVV